MVSRWFFLMCLNIGNDKSAITIIIIDKVLLSNHISVTKLIESKLKYANLPIGYRIKPIVNIYIHERMLPSSVKKVETKALTAGRSTPMSEP